MLSHVIPRLNKPSVIDADALTLLADDSFELPRQAVITPHAGEMQKLLRSSSPLILNETLMQICQNYAEKNEVTLVLKGLRLLSFIRAPQFWLIQQETPAWQLPAVEMC